MPHPAYTYDHISSRKVRGRDNDMLSGEQTHRGRGATMVCGGEEALWHGSMRSSTTGSLRSSSAI